MNQNRRLRLWQLLVEHADDRPVTVGHVGTVVLATAGVDRAAVTVVLAAMSRQTLATSGPEAAELEELTLTLGEGPGIDAVEGGPVLVSDLAAAECLTRWPMFAPAALDLGVRAVFALPLRVGGVRLGTIDLFRDRPGDLSGEQLADALVLADTACALLLDDHQHAGSPPNGHRPESAGLHHAEVHQATGMMIVQLGVSAAVALVRLRAYAYANDRRLRDVAGDVVARRLRFEPDPERDG